MKEDAGKMKKEKQEEEQGSKFGWKVFAGAVSMLATLATRKGLEAIWQKAAGKEPPTEPAHPDVGLLEATAWAGLSAALGALVRVVVIRRAAAAWERASGSPPPAGS